MKKFVTLSMVILLSVQLFARISIMCDVIRENSFADWTDYHRTRVEFLTKHEMKFSLDENKLYAIIWYSQTQCSVIEMEYDGVLLNKEIDLNFMFYYLGFDILNEGKDGVEINGDKEIRWKIYGKDENSLIIDSRFNAHPYYYNDAVYEKMRQGFVKKRKRPAEETKYAGMDKGFVKWHNDPYYIIKCNDQYIVLIRNTWGYWSGTIKKDDMLMGYFKIDTETSIDNITRNQTGTKALVAYIGNDYQSCVNWINEYINTNL